MKCSLSLLAVFLLYSPRVPAGQFVYVSEGGNDSIAIYRQDPETGRLRFLDRQETAGSPGSLDVGPQRRFLFAALRSSRNIASYRIDPLTGGLTPVSTTAPNEDPAYVYVDRTGQWLLSAYYRAGQVAVHRIEEDGRLEREGHWYATAERAHCIRMDRVHWYVYVPHTGAERIHQFEFNHNSGRLIPLDPPYAETPEGSGPRHIWFHPRLYRAYVDNEQGSSVTTYDLDVDDGLLKPAGTVSTLPDDFTGNNSNADIEVTPDGRFLYVSNRGHDSIAGFALDDGGTPTPLGTFPTEETPRSFNIDPTGRYLYAAGQSSNRLAAYRIQSNGHLERFETHDTGESPAWVLVVDTDRPSLRRSPP